MGAYGPLLGAYGPLLGAYDPLLGVYGPLLGAYGPLLMSECQFQKSNFGPFVNINFQKSNVIGLQV